MIKKFILEKDTLISHNDYGQYLTNRMTLAYSMKRVEKTVFFHRSGIIAANA